MAKQSTEPLHYPADKARQGTIILNTRRRRLVFFGGWILGVLVLLALPFILGAF